MFVLFCFAISNKTIDSNQHFFARAQHASGSWNFMLASAATGTPRTFIRRHLSPYKCIQKLLCDLNPEVEFMCLSMPMLIILRKSQILSIVSYALRWYEYYCSSIPSTMLCIFKFKVLPILWVRSVVMFLICIS